MKQRLQTFKYGLGLFGDLLERIFRLGFLDGIPGFIIASSSFYECIIKYGRMAEVSESSGCFQEFHVYFYSDLKFPFICVV